MDAVGRIGGLLGVVIGYQGPVVLGEPRAVFPSVPTPFGAPVVLPICEIFGDGRHRGAERGSPRSRQTILQGREHNNGEHVAS